MSNRICALNSSCSSPTADANVDCQSNRERGNTCVDQREEDQLAVRGRDSISLALAKYEIAPDHGTLSANSLSGLSDSKCMSRAQFVTRVEDLPVKPFGTQTQHVAGLRDYEFNFSKTPSDRRMAPVFMVPSSSPPFLNHSFTSHTFPICLSERLGVAGGGGPLYITDAGMADLLYYPAVRDALEGIWPERLSSHEKLLESSSGEFRDFQSSPRYPRPPAPDPSDPCAQQPDPRDIPFGMGFHPDGVSSVRGVLDRINLGQSADFGVLEAWLPREYEPTVSVQTMREMLLPYWMEKKTLTWTDAATHIDFEIEPVPGAFWYTKPMGYYYMAILNAIVTLHSYADIVDELPVGPTACRVSSESLRTFIEDANWSVVIREPHGDLPPYEMWIEVDMQGAVVASRRRDAPPNGWANAYQNPISHTIHFGEKMKVSGALADYYFWWAHRLLGYSIDCQSLRHLVLALFCARCAMAEIGENCNLLMHEMMHFHEFGGGGHCTHSGDPKDCCNDTVPHGFSHLLWAKMGLPLPHMPDRTNTDRSGGRFSSNEWNWEFTGSNYSLNGSHCSVVRPAHDLRIDWSIARDCATGATSGYEVYRENGPDCIPTAPGGGGGGGGGGKDPGYPPGVDPGGPTLIDLPEIYLDGARVWVV